MLKYRLPQSWHWYAEPPMTPAEKAKSDSYGGWVHFMVHFGLRPDDDYHVNLGKILLKRFAEVEEKKKAGEFIEEEYEEEGEKSADKKVDDKTGDLKLEDKAEDESDEKADDKSEEEEEEAQDKKETGQSD